MHISESHKFDSRVQGVQRKVSSSNWLASAIFVERLMRGCVLSLSRGLLGQNAPLLGAGVGRFLVAKLADRLRRQHMDVVPLLDTGYLDVGDPADCTPAVAVAKLARIRP